MTATASLAAKSNFFSRLAAFRERNGGLATLNKALNYVLHKAFRVSLHDVVWLDHSAIADMRSTDDRFEYRFLTADEVAELAKDPTFYIAPQLAEGVRSGREVCFAALCGGRLAAFGCYTLQYVESRQAAGTAMSFPANVAYMSFGFTHPDFRGARLHGFIMGLALQELSKRGVNSFVSLVEWINCSSLKSCERLGYIRLGRMLTIGGKIRAIGLYPKQAKQLGVRFGRSAVRPV